MESGVIDLVMAGVGFRVDSLDAARLLFGGGAILQVHMIDWY